MYIILAIIGYYSIHIYLPNFLPNYLGNNLNLFLQKIEMEEITKPKNGNSENTLTKKALEFIRTGSKKESNLSSREIEKLTHDLSVSQLQIKQQNEQLIDTNKELENLILKYTDLYDFAPVGYFLLDNTGVIQEANLTGANLFALERNLLIGKSFAHYIVSDYKQPFRSKFNEVFVKGVCVRCEVKIIRKIVNNFFAELLIEPVKDCAGKIVQCHVAVIDIHEHKQSLLALNRAKWFSDSLNHINKVVHSSLDADQIMQKLLSEGVKILQCQSGAILRRKDEKWLVEYVYGLSPDLVGTERTDQQEIHALRAIKTGKPIAITDAFNDERFNIKHMRKLSVRSILAAPLIINEQPIGVICFHYDSKIHNFEEQEIKFSVQLAATASVALENSRLFEQQKKAEQKLANQKELLESIFDNIPILLCIWDPDLQRFTLNEFAQKTIGWTDEDANSFDFMEKVYPDPNYRQEVIQFMQNRQTCWKELQTTVKSGQEIPINWANIHLSDQTSVGIGVDLRELKEAEAALRTSENRLRLFIEHAPAALAMFDKDMKYLNVSRRWLKDYGLAENIIGKSHYEVSPNLPEHWKESHRKGLSGQVVRATEEKYLKTDGTVHWIHWEVYPWYDVNEEVAGIVIFTEDITDRKVAEEQLQKSKTELESRVEQRTMQLSKMIFKLEKEIQERELAESNLQNKQRELRDLTSKLQLAEETERRRIAQDLHDSIGQILAFSARELKYFQKKPDQLSPERLKEVTDQLDKAITQSRTLSFDLSPSILYDLGFEIAVEDLAEKMCKKQGVNFKFENYDALKPLKEEVKILLYRSVRELLINIMKHANATLVTISILRSSSEIYIKIEDDGKGFDLAEIESDPKKRKGFGLLSIRERLDHLGGTMKLDSQPGKGAKTVLIAPLDV